MFIVDEPCDFSHQLLQACSFLWIAHKVSQEHRILGGHYGHVLNCPVNQYCTEKKVQLW